MDGCEGPTGERRVTIVVIDDVEPIRTALARVIERSPQLRLIGQAADFPSAFDLLESAVPDIAVIDRSMPGSDPTSAFKELRARFPRTWIVLLTGTPVELVEAPLLDTVDGCLDKCVPLSDAVASLESVALHQLAG